MNDLCDRLTRDRGEALVVEKCCVARPCNSPVCAVRRELRQLALSGRPAFHLADTCTQDSERLAVKAAQSFRLVEDRRQLQELDPAGCQLPWGAVERASGIASPPWQRTEPAPQGNPPHDGASGQWEERRGALELPVERAVIRKAELIRGRRVDQRDTGDLARILGRVDERIGASYRVSGKDIRPRDMRG